MSIEQALKEKTKTLVESLGYQLYDYHYNPVSKLCQVFIQDPKTKTAVIEDCVAVDRGFDTIIEGWDEIPDDFTLEVSSPGTYRVLKNPEHFEWVKGERAKIKLSSQSELVRGGDFEKVLLGKVIAVNDQKVVLELINESKVEIGFDDIVKANLEPEFD